MFRFSPLLLLALAAAPCLFAVDTKTWLHTTRESFSKGELKGLSLRSDGRLTLAPVSRDIFSSSEPYLWALAADSKGNIYAGGGGPGTSKAKLFAIDPAGKVRTVAEIPGLQIQALAVDSGDRIYAATIPDGKVYRISAGGTPEIFYEPNAKYIWALAFNSRGDLFVATGDTGEIHRVSADGKGSVFFRTEETHARSLVIDRSDNVLVGTEPGGLILRVSPAGEGFVLYQSPKREVTSLAVAADGNLYAAVAGNKTASTTSGPPSGLSLPVPPAPIAAPPAGSTPTLRAAPAPAPSGLTPSTSTGTIAGGSEVYRIAPDNYVQRVWSNPEEFVYAIALDAGGRPVLGTGNKGNVYRVDTELISTLLVNTAPTQVTALLTGPKGSIVAATGNMGKLIRLGPELETQGQYESEPLDGASFAYWGRAWYEGETNGGTIKIETRSGNLDRPQKNWSPWAAIDPKTSRSVSPASRFLQYRVTMGTAASSAQAPEVRAVGQSYMAKNVPPVIQDVQLTPVNYKFQAPLSLVSSTSSTSLTLPAMGRSASSTSLSVDALSSSASQTMQLANGFVGLRWMSSDPNEDSLTYKLEIRGVGEQQWKLLKSELKEKYFSWDSNAYADGFYIIRVTASDSPANPKDQALTAQIETERLLIDNTAPTVQALNGTRTGNRIALKWSARDASSTIQQAEYSLDGGEWTRVLPVSRLSDSAELDYSLTVEAGPGEHTVAVKITDKHDNEVVEKVVVR